jgi:UBA/TS-N domain
MNSCELILSLACSVEQLQADRDIATIVEMGFNAKEATAALQRTAGNVELALNSLLNNEKPPGAATTNGRALGAGEPKSSGVTDTADNADGWGRGEARSHGGTGKADGLQRERGG